MNVGYSNELINNMCSLHNSLSEKDRRRYAAVEAKKLGHGGVIYIAMLFGCDEKTIKKGITELNNKVPRQNLWVDNTCKCLFMGDSTPQTPWPSPNRQGWIDRLPNPTNRL